MYHSWQCIAEFSDWIDSCKYVWTQKQKKQLVKESILWVNVHNSIPNTFYIDVQCTCIYILHTLENWKQNKKKSFNRNSVFCSSLHSKNKFCIHFFFAFVRSNQAQATNRRRIHSHDKITRILLNFHTNIEHIHYTYRFTFTVT